MARMIDTLKSAETNPRFGFPEKAMNPGKKPVIKLVAETEEEESMEEVFPFIEWDGRTRTIDGSPDVLAFPVPSAPEKPKLAKMEEITEPALVSPDTESPSAKQVSGGTPAENLLVYHQPKHPSNQQYFRLIEHLFAGSGPPRVLLFSALNFEVPIAHSVVNLALAACKNSPGSVILVDLNPGPLSVGAHLNLADSPGLQAVLAGNLALDQAVQATKVANLSALLFGDAEEAVEITEELRCLIGELQEHFDAVFVNGPAWNCREKVLELALACDATFPVVSQSDGQAAGLQEMIQIIAGHGGQVRGLIQVRS